MHRVRAYTFCDAVRTGHHTLLGPTYSWVMQAYVIIYLRIHQMAAAVVGRASILLLELFQSISYELMMT